MSNPLKRLLQDHPQAVKITVNSEKIEDFNGIYHLPIEVNFQAKTIANVILITDMVDSLVIVDNNG